MNVELTDIVRRLPQLTLRRSLGTHRRLLLVQLCGPLCRGLPSDVALLSSVLVRLSIFRFICATMSDCRSVLSQRHLSSDQQAGISDRCSAGSYQENSEPVL